ncbi:hypothetical protein ACFL6L_04875 [candidate division KSB1 bacterium]
MCRHSRVEFIGYQECPNSDPIPLYNCMECHTTITLGTLKKLMESPRLSLQSHFPTRQYFSK